MRLAQDWEVEMVISLYEWLYSHRIWYGVVDKLVWSLSKRGHFEMKSFYKALASRSRGFLIILMHDNLHRRNIVVVEWCCMCKKSGESIDHLLFHCDVAQDIWSIFIICLGWSGPCRDGC